MLAARVGVVPGLHPLGLLEVTPVSIPVFLAGILYLLTLGRRLTPARVDPEATLTQRYGVERHLSQVVVRETSPLVGVRPADVRDLIAAEPWDRPIPEVGVLQVVREGEPVHALSSDRPLEAGDVLTVRASPRDLNAVADRYGLRQLPHERVSAGDLDVREGRGRLVEAVVPEGSRLAGETVREANLAAYHGAQVLAVRRGDAIEHGTIGDHDIAIGDTLLVQVRERDLRYLVENTDLVVTSGVGIDEPEVPSLSSDTPLVLGTLAAVVLLAATGALPIPIAAIGGVVVLTASGAISPTDAFSVVDWNVVVLLGALFPLGSALSASGAAAFLAAGIAVPSGTLPPIAMLGVVFSSRACSRRSSPPSRRSFCSRRSRFGWPSRSRPTPSPSPWRSSSPGVRPSSLRSGIRRTSWSTGRGDTDRPTTSGSARRSSRSSAS